MKSYCARCRGYYPLELALCLRCRVRDAGASLIPTEAEVAGAGRPASTSTPIQHGDFCEDAEKHEIPLDQNAPAALDHLVGASPAMNASRRLVRIAGQSHLPVLITGETGTGKTLVAHLIHEISGGGKLIILSPTRASEVRRFAELCSDGAESGEANAHVTILLDDVDRYRLDVQARIHEELAEIDDRRTLQPEHVVPGPRFLATARGAASRSVAQGTILPELYHQISVLQVDLPPLRHRQDDLPLLLHWFSRMHDPDRNHQLPCDMVVGLKSYGWPGNVREVESAVQRAIALAETSEPLKVENLLPANSRAEVPGGVTSDLRLLKNFLVEAEREHILRTLRLLGGHRVQDAGALGISRKNLWEKLRSYGLSLEQSPGPFAEVR